MRAISLTLLIVLAGFAVETPGAQAPLELVWGRVSAPDCRADDDRVPVLLLGSYHMSNPGMDMFNLEADDVLAPARQAEIRALVDRLAAFNPTKVAVEAPWADSTTVARYEAYAAGARELRRSEEEQIGFRLAHQLGHEAIYPVDVQLMLDNAALGPVIAANPAHGSRMAELEQIGQLALDSMGTWLATGTISEMLHRMNRPESLHLAHEVYFRVFVPIVEADDYAGADLTADWYRRNLRIFANLNRIAAPGDRLLVVYGQGHIPTLKQFAADSPYFCLEDPLPYLR